MLSDRTRFKILFALLTLLIAFYYPNIKSAYDHYMYYYLNANVTNINSGFDTGDVLVEREIIKSWKNLIHLPPRDKQASKLKIAIGLNTNVDLILSGTKLLKKLNINANVLPKNHISINNLNEFKENFMYYFGKGSAAERSFSNLEDFNKVLEATEDIKKQWFIGGNAALMAQGISQRFSNCDVLLIGPVGPKLRDLLNSNIRIPKNCQTPKDEIHLILEYVAKEEFENIQSANANRYIISHDIYNSRMEMLDDFFNLTNEFKPNLVILSGLHLLESQNQEFREQKLDSIKNNLSNMVPSGVVHLELASIGDKNLMKMILDKNIFLEINSLGLNEQELLFLSHSYETAPHSNYFLEINDQPDLIKVIDIMEWILIKYGHSGDLPLSKFSRIHFHCLMFHIIAELDTKNWSNTISSLVSGSKIAAKQACGFDFNDESSEQELENLIEFRMAHSLDDQKNILFKIDENKYAKFNLSMPVIEFHRGNIKFSFTPVLVCKQPTKTVGLGDAISSSGLIYSEYNFT